MNKRILCVGAVALLMLSMALLSAPAQAKNEDAGGNGDDNGDRPDDTGIYDFNQNVTFNEIVTVDGLEYGVNFDGTLFPLGSFLNVTNNIWYNATKGPSACVADWSDDLILHQWRDGQKVRTEVVLRLPNNASAYTIRAHFTIDALNDDGSFKQMIFDGTTWEGLWVDGPTDAYSAEVNQLGQLLYGYNWDTKNDEGGAGLYRLTFSIDAVEDVALSPLCPYTIGSYEDVSIVGLADSVYGDSAYTTEMGFTSSSTSIVIELL